MITPELSKDAHALFAATQEHLRISGAMSDNQGKHPLVTPFIQQYEEYTQQTGIILP